MSRVAYVNGRYVPHREAAVHVEDRGYQFADGVYEVVCLQHGAVIDEDPHIERLERSLGELRIPMPVSTRAYKHITRELARRNGVKDGIVYTQITRGVARRDHVFPAAGTPPSIVMTSRRIKPQDPKMFETGVAVMSTPDIRWARCDIKSVSLLPNILAKQAAREAGAYEAWFVDKDGNVTEGGSTNAWIVTKDGDLVTRQLGNAILGGITRRSLVKLAADAQIKIVERPFSLEEARSAREAFLTSTTSFVTPITKIDGKPVGTGKPGPLAARLRELYYGYMGTPEPTAS